MQLAMASYFCPGAAGNTDGQNTSMAQVDMPCAETMSLTMDSEQPSLCHAYCKADSQTAGAYQAVGLASFPELASEFPIARALPASSGVLLQAPLLMRTTAPPLAVRHCCFRI